MADVGYGDFGNLEVYSRLAFDQFVQGEPHNLCKMDLSWMQTQVPLVIELVQFLAFSFVAFGAIMGPSFSVLHSDSTTHTLDAE